MKTDNVSSNAVLRVALLSFAHTHARGFASLLSGRPDIELITTDPDGHLAPDSALRGAELAADIGVDYVDSYEEAMAWKPDAVIVASENSRHRELVEMAAEAGAHILCEKPMATTLGDAQAMIEVTDAAGVTLMIAYPVRFSPSFEDAVARVRAGELGTILGIRGTNNGKLPIGERSWFTHPDLAGGGALVDHVVHCADLIDALLEESPRTVRAVSNRILHSSADLRVETGGLVTMEYPSGVIATIDCSWSFPDAASTWGGLTLQLVGTNGVMNIAPFAQHLSGYNTGGAVYTPVGDKLDSVMLEVFLNAVRSGESPQPDAQVGLRTLQVVDAARRSAETGQPIQLSE